MELIALKRLPYRTRHMEAGDTSKLPIQVGEVFKPASDKLGRILIAIKKARDPNHRKPGSLPPPPASLSEKVAVPPVVEHAAPVEMKPEHDAAHEDHAAPVPHTAHEAPHHDPQHELRDTLRARAEALGIDVDRRWGVERLSEEIEAGISRAGKVSHDG